MTAYAATAVVGGDVASRYILLTFQKRRLCCAQNSGGNWTCAIVPASKAGNFCAPGDFARDQRWQQFLPCSKMLSIYGWHFKDMNYALKLVPLKLNVCSRTCAEATVYTVPFICHCVHAHWAAHYTFMSTFVYIRLLHVHPVTITAVGQEVLPHTMERQAIKSPSSKQTQTDFCECAHTCECERIWMESVLRVHVRSRKASAHWSTATLPTSARVPGDYVPDWHMLEFTSIGLLCTDWRLDFSSPDNFIKTVMVRQSVWQAENKRMKGRRQERETEERRPGMNDLDCNGYKCCFSSELWSKGFNPPPPAFSSPPSTLQPTLTPQPVPFHSFRESHMLTNSHS